MAKSLIKQKPPKPKKKSSSQRLIPFVKHNGSNINTPPITAEYVGSRGILFRSDCLDLLTNIRDNTIDLVFADPPFNLGKSYGTLKYTDEMAVESYRGWCRTWLLESIRVLKPGGALFLYHWPMWLMDFGAWLNSLNLLDYRNWIALKMKNGFPIKGRVQPAHYGILYFVKKGGDPTFNVVRTKSPTCRHCKKLIRDYGGYRDKFKRFEDEEGIPWIGISDFWEDTRPARHDKARQNQVNELPLHVPERVILMASNPDDVILDCFAGGGSTLHAAHLHNRLWIGGEISKPSAALRRIATFIGTDETANPPRRLLTCLTKQTRDAVTHIDTNNRNRPIVRVKHLSEVSASMEREASKSKVLGF
jgi:site-specific DNA-methyltransferase (adenine-specific)